MNYHDFIKQTDHCIDKMTPVEMKQLIRQFAADVPSESRAEFIHTLNGKNTDSNPSETDHLMRQITELYEAVRDGDLCNGYGWDDEINDERDWGDESWAPAMDQYLQQARKLLLAGYSQAAREAYQMLIQTLEEGQEPGHLPGSPDPTEMLQENLQEHLASYLCAVYLSEEPDNRPAVIFKEISRCHDWSLQIGLNQMSGVIEKPLPDIKRFLNDWLAYIVTQESQQKSFLIRDTLVLQGPDELADFTSQHYMQYPELFMDWIDLLRKDKQFEKAAQVATEGLSLIQHEPTIQAEIGDRLNRIGKELKNTDLQMTGAQAAYQTSPTLNRLLLLLQQAWKMNAFNAVSADVCQQENASFEESCKQAENSLIKGCQVFALLLCGHYDDVWLQMQKSSQKSQTTPGYLGWTYGDNPRPVFLAFLMEALAWSCQGSLVVSKQKIDQFQDAVFLRSLDHRASLRSEPDDDLKLYHYLTDKILDVQPLEPGQKQRALQWIQQETLNRIHAIVSNKHRHSYDKAAELLAATVECLKNYNRTQEAIDLVNQVKSQYSRYSAFRAELAKAVR